MIVNIKQIVHNFQYQVILNYMFYYRKYALIENGFPQCRDSQELINHTQEGISVC